MSNYPQDMDLDELDPLTECNCDVCHMNEKG